MIPGIKDLKTAKYVLEAVKKRKRRNVELMKAVLRDDEKTVKKALQRGADPNVNLLNLSIACGFHEIMKSLVEYGANVNGKNQSGKTEAPYPHNVKHAILAADKVPSDVVNIKTFMKLSSTERGYDADDEESDKENATDTHWTHLSQLSTHRGLF